MKALSVIDSHEKRRCAEIDVLLGQKKNPPPFFCRNCLSHLSQETFFFFFILACLRKSDKTRQGRIHSAQYCLPFPIPNVSSPSNPPTLWRPYQILSKKLDGNGYLMQCPIIILTQTHHHEVLIKAGFSQKKKKNRTKQTPGVAGFIIPRRSNTLS